MSDSAARKGRGRTFRGFLFGVAPLLVIGAAVYAYATGGRYVTTENAYVKAEIITISANIDGQVDQVRVQANAAVEKGQILFTIDARPHRMALESATAQLASIRQKIDSLRAHYRQGERELAAAEERIRYLQKQHQRQEKLVAKGASTRVKLDETEHDLAMARQRLGVLQESNAMVLADLGGSYDLAAERHPLYLQAEADRKRAELDLAYTDILAPADGIVSNLTLEPGEYVEAGDALFALVTVHDPWIEANLKEVELTHVRIGQKAKIVVDSYPEVTWEAVVDSISPATGAEFAILPPQNATGNWVKVVQRIPVRLRLEGVREPNLLRAGMTATVSIDTGRERDTMAFIKGVVATPFQD